MSEEIMNLSVFDTLCIKKPTKLGNIIEDMPKPPFFIEADDVPPLLKTRRLDEKIPCIPIPLRYKTNYTRGRLGEEAVGQINVGDIVINDPYNYEMERKYEEVHDPSLSAYYNKPANIKRLKDLKIINDEHEILCSLKDYNNFRRFLHRKNIPHIKEIINREVNEKKEKRKFYQFLKNSKVAYQSSKKQDRVNMAKKEAEAKKNQLSAMNPRCKSRLDRIVIANIFHDTVMEKKKEENRKKGQDYKERMEDYFKEYDQIARRYKIDYYKKSKLLDEHVANRIQEIKERKQAARLRYNDKRWISRRDQQMALIKQNAFHLKQYKRYFETMSLRRKWGFNEAVFEQNELEDLSDEEDLDVTESKEKMHAELKYSDEFKQALNGGKFHIVQLPGSEHKASKALRKYIRHQETPMDRMVKKTVPRAVKEAVALTFRRAVFLYAFKVFYQNMLESVEEAEASALKIRGKPDLRRVLMDEYAKFGPRSNIPMASIERSLCLRFDEEGKSVKYPCVHCCDGGGVCCIPAKRYKPRKKTIGGYYYNCPLCEPELHYKPRKRAIFSKEKSQSTHERRKKTSERQRPSFDSVGTAGTFRFKTAEVGDANASTYSLKSFSRGKSVYESGEDEHEESKPKKEGKKTPQSAIKRKAKSTTKAESNEKINEVSKTSEVTKKTDKGKHSIAKPDESVVRFNIEHSESETTQKTTKSKKKRKTSKKTKKRAKSKESSKSTKSKKSKKGNNKKGKKKKTVKLLKSLDLNDFFNFSSGISISTNQKTTDSNIKDEITKEDPFYDKRTLYDYHKEPSTSRVMEYGPLLKSPLPKREKAHKTEILNIHLPDVPEITGKQSSEDSTIRKLPEYIPELTSILKSKVKKYSTKNRDFLSKTYGKIDPQSGVPLKDLDKNRTWYIPTGDSAHYATLKRNEVKFYCIDNDCNKCAAPILKVPNPTKMKSQKKETIIIHKTPNAEIGTQCSDHLLKKEADLYKKKKPLKSKIYKTDTVKLTGGPKVDKTPVVEPPLKSAESKHTESQVKIKPILRQTVGKDLKKRETKKTAFVSDEAAQPEVRKSIAKKSSIATPQTVSTVSSKKDLKPQESKTSDIKVAGSAASLHKKENQALKEKPEIENVQEGLNQTQINAKKLLRNMSKKRKSKKSKETKTNKKKLIRVQSSVKSFTKETTPTPGPVVEETEPSSPRIIKPKIIRKEEHNVGNEEEEGIIEDKKIKEIKHYCPACDPEQEVKRKKIVPLLDIYKKEESKERESRGGSKAKKCSGPILPSISTDIYKSGKKLIMERDRKSPKKALSSESSSESSSDDYSDSSDDTSTSDSDQEIKHTCKCKQLNRNPYETYGRYMEPEETEDKESHRRKKSPEETKVKTKSKKSEEHKDFVTIMEKPLPWKANRESVTNPIIKKEKPTKIKTTGTTKTYEKYKKMRENYLPVYFYDKEGRKYSIDNEGKTYHLTSEGHLLPEKIELNLFDVKPSGSKFFVDNEGRLYKKDVKGKEELIGAADKYRVDYKGRKYYLDKDGKKFIVDLEGNVLLFDEDHQRYSLDATGKKIFLLPEVHKGNVRFDSRGNLIKPQIQKEDELSKFLKGAKLYADPEEHRVIAEKEGILYYISSDGKKHELKGDTHMYRVGSDGNIYLEDSAGLKFYEKTPIKSPDSNATKTHQPTTQRQESIDKGVNFGKITAINDVDEQELAIKDLKSSLARPPTPGANVYEGKYGIRKIHRLADLTKSAPTHPELERIFVQKRKLFDCAHVVLQRVLAYALWKITKLEENDLLTLPIFLRNMQRPKMKAMEMVEGITKISLYYPVKYLTSKRLSPYVDLLTRHILYTKNFDIFARPERLIEADIFSTAEEQHDEDFMDNFFKDLRKQLLSRKFSYVSFNEREPMEYIVEDGEDGTNKVLPQNINIPSLPGYYSGVQSAKTEVTAEMVKFGEDGKEPKTPDEGGNGQTEEASSIPLLNLVQGTPTFPTTLSSTQTPTEMAQVLYYLRVMATQPRLIKPAKSGHVRKQQSRNLIKKQKMKMRNKSRKVRSRPNSKNRSKSSKSSRRKRSGKKKQKRKAKKMLIYSYGKLEEVFSEISLCDEDIDEGRKSISSKKQSLKEIKKDIEEHEEVLFEEVENKIRSSRSPQKSEHGFTPTTEIIIKRTTPSIERTEPEPKSSIKKSFQPIELPKEEPVVIRTSKIIPKPPKIEKIERERSSSECRCIRDIPTSSDSSKIKDYIYSDSSEETGSTTSNSTSSLSNEDSEEIKVDKIDKRSKSKSNVSKKKKGKDVPEKEENKIDTPKNVPAPCALPVFSRADIQKIQWEQHIPGFDRKRHMALLFKLIHAKLNKNINFTDTECTCDVIFPDLLTRSDPNYLLKIILESKMCKRDSIHDKYQHSVDHINNFNKPVRLLPQREARIQKLEEILRQQINIENEDVDDTNSQSSKKPSVASIHSQKKKETRPSVRDSSAACLCTGNCIVTQSFSKMHDEMLKNMKMTDKVPMKGLGAKYKKNFMDQDPSKQNFARRGKICFDAREAWERLLAERRAEAAREAEALRLAKEAEALRLAEEAEALRLAQVEPEKVTFGTNIEITYTTKKTTETKSSESKSVKSKKSKKGKKKRGKSKPGKGKSKTRTTTRTTVKTVTRTKTRSKSGTKSIKKSTSAKATKTNKLLIRDLKKGKAKVDKLNKSVKKSGK